MKTNLKIKMLNKYLEIAKVKLKSGSVSHPFVSNSLQSMDCNPPSSSLHRISQARILEWVAIFYLRGSFKPRDRTQVSCIASRFFFLTIWTTRKWKWSHSVMFDSLRPHGLQLTRLLGPWNFPGKSTGVDCHTRKAPKLKKKKEKERRRWRRSR